MNKFTSADYIKAVKEAIEAAKKSSEYDYILLNPSPAKLRDICMAIYNDKATSSDKKIFEHFFKLSLEVDITKQFLSFNVDKLRPVRNFIIGDSGRPSFAVVELLAILADYERRPLRKFLGGEKEVLQNKEEAMEVDSVGSEEVGEGMNSEEIVTNKKQKNWIIITVITIIMFLGGLVTNRWISDKPGCMFWDQSHYKAIDCDSQLLGLGSFRKIVPVQEHLFRHFKKIEVNPETIFFQNNKPIVWYGKNLKGEYEYFTYSGEHPETGKYLRPITNYHINKYVNRE